MDIIKKALEFEKKKISFPTTTARIKASREAKDLILGINEIYKNTKEQRLMDIMKRLTIIKRKIEKRLKGKPLTA